MLSACLEWTCNVLFFSFGQICWHVNLSHCVHLQVIPKSACLSIRTTAIADQLADEGLVGGLGLTISVMVECARGTLSRWAGYFKSLPKAVPVPIFWSKSDVASLSGTELDGAVDGEKAALADDYTSLVVPFIKKQIGGDIARLCDFNAFCRAASLVSSRAFHVDAYHGDAMVPFADIFNHRSAVIVLGGGIAIEGHGDSSDDECTDEQSADKSHGSEATDSDHSEDASVTESKNEITGIPISKSVREELRAIPSHSEHPLNIAICNREADESTPAALEIVLMHPVSRGDEIWNT